MGEQKEQVERIYQRIIFQECNQDNQLRKLNKSEKERLKDVISQKMMNQAVSYQLVRYFADLIPNKILFNLPILIILQILWLHSAASFIHSKTSNLSKLAVLFFAGNSLVLFSFGKAITLHAEEDAQSQPDMYGPLWLTITYIIILALSSNLNNYFANKTTFSFNTNFLIQAAGFEILFMTIQTLLYPAVIGCIDGEISNLQSTNLIGYSLLLYFIPTFLCVVPSQVWHLAMLVLGAIMRFIFLGRNFGSRVDNKHILVYTIILVIQLLHFYLINVTFFSIVAGTSIDSGMQKVFHSRVFIN